MDRVTAIRDRLTEALAPESLEVIDESHKHIGHAGAASGAGHFVVSIVTDKFKDQNLVQRHRMVYQAVDDLMPGEIHALSIQAFSPEERSSQSKA
jgi:BolA protein